MRQDYGHPAVLRYSASNLATSSSFFALLPSSYTQNPIANRTLVAARDTTVTPEGAGPVGRPLWEISAQCDRADLPAKGAGARRVSAHSGEGLTDLRKGLIVAACSAMPLPGQAALNRRQADCLDEVRNALMAARAENDPLLVAECLRLARRGLDRLVGATDVEAMLDALFGRFCIGK